MPDLEKNRESEPSEAQPTVADLVRIQLAPEDLAYDSIKSAIYMQAKYLFDRGARIRNLLLSGDLYEILNKRLVFKTPAHKDLPHFITPFGNLLVQKMGEDLEAPLSFIISEA